MAKRAAKKPLQPSKPFPGCSLGHGVSRSRFASSLCSLQSLCPDVLSFSKNSILLLDSSTLHLLVWSSKHLPDSLTLEKSRQVSVSHLWLWQVPVDLSGTWFAPCTIETIKLLEGRLSPDAESSNMTTRSKLKEIKIVNLNSVNSWNVSEGFGQSLVIVIDHQRSPLLHSASVPQFSLSCSHAFGGINLGNISPSL